MRVVFRLSAPRNMEFNSGIKQVSLSMFILLWLVDHTTGQNLSAQSAFEMRDKENNLMSGAAANTAPPLALAHHGV
jgi:hypothetical protein